MSVDDMVRVVRVFVSSPADVAPERGRVQAVTAKLNRDFEGAVRFQPVLWEEHFYKADRTFQPQIPESTACDVLVSIFWTRIGTELPADFARMPDGKPYPSGTAYELLTALEASRANGVPDIYVFRKTADVVLPTADAERFRQAQTQFEALEAFWKEWFKSEQGRFKAAFQTFANTDEFERQIEQLLRQWLETHGLLGPRLRWPKEKGSPFRGLAPFEAEHSAVFFGRDRIVDEARRRLVAAADRGTPFLLIVGASGSGKSSLARAGLIPRLTTPGVVSSVEIWRVARMRPSEGQSGPVASLASALFAAVPELEQGDFSTVGALTDNLRRGAPVAARPIVRALARLGEAAQREQHAQQPLRAALVVLVDQFEELFARAVTDEERACFAEALKELLATGQVWFIGTLRADLYELLLRQPVLKAMKEAGASLDLGPPGPAELAEMVRAPAAAAGLVFETNARLGALDDRLLADAKTPDSLPLLQFTLRELYDRRTESDGETRLTHAAYEALGGLQGAIAAEAERAVAGLPAGTFEALPRLLRQVAEPARDGKALTLREVAQADVAAEPAEAALVDALVGARILIAHQDAGGRAVLRLAHDAVLTSWPRAAAAAQASREFYRVRAEVEEALARWQDHGRPRDRLLQPGVPLAEAEKLVADFGRELPQELLAFVRSSRDRARARQRLVAAAAVFFLCLSIAATGAGIWARREQLRAVASERQAVASEQQAVASEQRARAERNKALLHDSRRLLDLVAQAGEDTPTTTALLALEGLPGLNPDEQRPFLPALETNLYRSVDQLREMLVLDDPAQSPKTGRMATADRTGAVSVYDVDSGRQVLDLQGHQAKVNKIAFSDDGKLIATASADETARLWDAKTGATQAVLALHTGAVTFIHFEDGDRSVITLSDDGSLRRWSVPDGRPLAVFPGHEGGVRRYAANYKARRLATVSMKQIIRLWDIDTGQELARPDSEDIASIAARNIGFTDLPFDDDGRWLLISRYGTQSEAILWDVAAGRAKARFDAVGIGDYFVDGHRLIELQPRNILDEKASTRLVDAETGQIILQQHLLHAEVKGDRFITRGLLQDKTARLWDAKTLTPKAELQGHTEPIILAQFIANGERIITAATDGTARIWNSDSGALLRVLKIPTAGSDSVKLSADERRMIVVKPDGGAELWDMEAGAKVRDLDSRETPSDDSGGKFLPLQAVALSPDGKRVAARLGGLQTVRVWDLESGSIVTEMGDVRDIRSLQFNRDGTRILASGDKTARILDVDNPLPSATIDQGLSAQFSEGGNAVIIPSDGSEKLGKAQPTRIWRVGDADGVFTGHSLAGHGRYGAVAVAAQQSTVLLASRDDARALGVPFEDSGADGDAIAMVDAGTGRILSTLKGASGLTPITASADGGRLLTLSEGKAQVWDTLTGKPVMDVELTDADRAGGSVRFAFSTDGKQLCFLRIDGGELKTSIWNVDSGGKVESTTKLDGAVELTDVDAGFSADGLRVTTVLNATLDHNWGRILAFDARTAAITLDLQSKDLKEKAVLSPGGRWILFVPSDFDNNRARLVDGGTGAEVGILEFSDGVHDAWFSPDESRILTASSGNAGLWNAGSAALMKSFSLKDDSGWISSVAFGPDGILIAIGTSAGSVYLYDPGAGKLRRLVGGSSGLSVGAAEVIDGISYSRDGQWLSVSGTSTNVIRNPGGDAVIAATAPSRAEQTMFTADNRYLVASDFKDTLSTSTIRRLFPTTAALVEFARARMPRCLTPVERRQYSLDPEPPLWCVEMAKWPYNTVEWARWLAARNAGQPADPPQDKRFPVEGQ